MAIPDFFPEVVVTDDEEIIPVEPDDGDPTEFGFEPDMALAEQAGRSARRSRRTVRRSYSREMLATEIATDSLVIMPGRPIKEQIANHFLNLISLGIFGPGDRLPPERWFAAASPQELTRSHVQDAYDVLEAMGIIERVPVRGAFVRGVDDSRMFFARQNMMETIGAAMRIQLTRSQIERAFLDALDAMYAPIDNEKLQRRRDIKDELQRAESARLDKRIERQRPKRRPSTPKEEPENANTDPT
uniref:HTH gntR-type domain-containing protein n=1 Tax=mine drainage metagenome TaxID=410659 RepID=E6QPA9_9ZZZZ